MSDRSAYQAPLRWGIIGCGDVTEVKSGPAYQQTEGFELAAVMRRDPEKVRDFARRHGVGKYYTDARQLIDDPEIDAVYIATPPDTHLLYARLVAAAGKPCCVEKPLAPSYADSLAIGEAFDRAGVPLFAAYYRRTLPRFVRVKEWLDAGAIGTVRHVSWQLTMPPKPVDLTRAPNWRTDPAVAPGGYFDDLASHGLDLFAYLLGDFREVHGSSLNQQELYGAKDAFTACWQHGSGTNGTGAWNFGCATAMDRVELLGSTGHIEFSVFDDHPVRLSAGDRLEEIRIEHPDTVQLPHVRAMRDALLQGRPHPSTGASGVHTSWVMDRILGVV